MSETDLDPEDVRMLVRFLRALHNWSPEELAERSGVDGATIREYENCGSTPSLEILESIADAANVPPFFLHSALIPLVQHVREIAWSDPGDLAGHQETEELADRIARRTAEVTRAHHLAVWARMRQGKKTKPQPN